eukprot:GFYU01022857.1.p1 GENE.GFYU01022857.1~~GFYU01022857.1.p1  ORF type:complete len:190 (-),score=49.99 GFYU01022857.1:151-696(-)
MSSDRPQYIKIEFTGTGASCKAKLLWDKAPNTCDAIVKQLPFVVPAWHGRNSGAEALLLTPSVISHLPQDETENATTVHELGNVMFGFEPKGCCSHAAEDAAEIAWIYGKAARAGYWVNEDSVQKAHLWESPTDPDHSKGPYKLVHARLNVFAQVEEENNFYVESARLARYGQQEVKVSAV